MMQKRRPLLIVEDDAALQKQMCWALDQYEAVLANDRESALTQIRRHEPTVVTVDLGLPPHPDEPTEGLALIEEILRLLPETKVIVITGQHDRANALKSVAVGAYDFCEKPFDPEVLNLIVARAYRLAELQEENRRLQAASAPQTTSGILTRDPQMQKLCRTVERVADTGATVMLLGDSGTGKELLARALHNDSQRRNERFVAINCAAIPENLLESELFGYEKGAFTGAVKQTAGKIQLADGGTLFLDEIGDLPLALQSKLLRFLQERVIERIGGRDEIPVDVRIVCATHQNLQDLIAAGKFRQDLYFRLAEIVLSIPPLRERKGDPSLLAHALVRRFADEQHRGNLTLSPQALEAIERHAWPGNVRELENRAKRAVIMADGPLLRADDFGLEPAAPEVELFNLRRVRDQAERETLVRVLGRVNGNISRAAELLGVSRPTLYDLMEKYGLRG